MSNMDISEKNNFNEAAKLADSFESLTHDDSDQQCTAISLKFIEFAPETDSFGGLAHVGVEQQGPATSINFLNFAPELRERIIDSALQGDLETGALKKAMHRDHPFKNPCCVWNWPEELIICDKKTEAELPHTLFPKWLPHMALTSPQMRGEVVVHMLKTTACITLKYYNNCPFKCSIWLSKFLEVFPNNEGFEAVRELNFPHFMDYNSANVNTTNPDVDLMLQFTKLRRVGMTFHWTCLVSYHPYEEINHPISLEYFLRKYKLREMLQCDSLEHVYIGGIQRLGANVAGDPLQTLRDFGKWLREEFAAKTPSQKVTVHLYPRYGRFNGWGNGQPL